MATQHIVLDPQMRFIPDNTKCFILFPGRFYAFYEDMRLNNLVFMDFPGFPLENIENSNFITDWEARVTVSDRIRRWYLDGENRSITPPRTTSELGNFRSTKRRRLFSGLIDCFLNGISKGDLIVIPSSDQSGKVLFEEILDKPGDVIRHPHPLYPREIVPARRVRWVKAARRGSIPRWLDTKFPSPNPLRQIESSFYPRVFDIAYERYHYKNLYVCKFIVTSKTFTALDNLELQKFFLIPAALNAAETNSPTDTVYQLIKRNADNLEDLDQRIDINSPGHIILISKTAAPFFAAMVLMVCSAAEEVQSKPVKITVQNSQKSLHAQIAKNCTIDMENEIARDLEMMSQKQWKEACEMGVSSLNSNGLKTGVK